MSEAGSPALLRWLRRIEANHPTEIDLGLERVGTVARRAGLDAPGMPIVLVGGTNGKGTVVHRVGLAVAGGGRRVGTYFSPHLHHFAERVRIDGHPVDEARLVTAFESIEAVRGEVSLTYFEWATLAAMQVFLTADCDVIVLEVGLGGRLDATNLWDADVAVVTSIDLDHRDWLGDTREAIGLEKIAIGRPGRPLVLGDPDPPAAVVARAREIGVVLQPLGAIAGIDRRNAACVTAVISALQTRLPVDATALQAALAAPGLAGRYERIELPPHHVVLDVAHNPAAAAALAERLSADRFDGPSVGILAMLADKDVEGVIRALDASMQSWHVAGLDVARGLDATALAGRIATEIDVCRLTRHDTLEAAWQAVRATAPAGARLVVTGSFHTVATVRGLLADALTVA